MANISSCNLGGVRITADYFTQIIVDDLSRVASLCVEPANVSAIHKIHIST